MEEHFDMINKLLTKNYMKVLDLGSGKTSMSILLEKFPNSDITGICYPDDNRKLDSIKQNCIGKYSLLEMDICKETPNEEFDLVLCHLLLGETLNFGNNLKDMINGVFSINAKEICIIDYLEDVDIDFELVKEVAKKNEYRLCNEYIMEKKVAQEFSNFSGKHYYGILLKK